MEKINFYHNEIPIFIEKMALTREMQRLKYVGMNCGCEYTSFDRFKNIQSYSRYEHSIGSSLIAWHFTKDMRASTAALFHDIATPVFAHTVDFMNGDYEKQESTENETGKIISSSNEIMRLLNEYELSLKDIDNYHKYPIADNDSPKLSADRLEYTIGNAINFRIASPATMKKCYEDLIADINENGEEEIIFAHEDIALEFSYAALECSKIYVSDEDRYSMQRLSEILKRAYIKKVIQKEDLYKTERELIAKLKGDAELSDAWDNYRSLSHMVTPEKGQKNVRIISAKKRRIDPFVKDSGRLSFINDDFRKDLNRYMALDFEVPIAAV